MAPPEPARQFRLSGLRVRDSAQLTDAQLVDELTSSQLVCLGERHAEAADAAAFEQLLASLLERARFAGRTVSLGLEAFGTANDRALGRYAQGELGRGELLAKTDYDANWGYPFAPYERLMARITQQGGELRGLDAPRSLVEKVAHGGLVSLDRQETAKLPELELSNLAHRRSFEDAMAAHPHAGRLDDLYAAQVLRDEWMSRAAASYLEGAGAAPLLVVLAGRAHCMPSAIPARTRRRLPWVSAPSVVVLVDPEPQAVQSLGAQATHVAVLTSSP